MLALTATACQTTLVLHQQAPVLSHMSNHCIQCIVTGVQVGAACFQLPEWACCVRVVNSTELQYKPPPPRPALPCPRYPSVCVFRHHNLRNELFKDLREQLKDTSK